MAKRTIGLKIMGIVMILYGLSFWWNLLSLLYLMLGLAYLFSGIFCLFGLSRSSFFRAFLLTLSVLTIVCVLITCYTQGDVPFEIALLLSSPVLIVPGYIIFYTTLAMLRKVK